MKPKVLIVDDEQFNVITFKAFLSEDGYDLHTASNGFEAIAMASSLLPDVILLDVMMPELDGFTVCRRIREDPVIGRVPIIIVTALHDSTARLEGLQAGADDFVTKPCSRDEMRARVRTIVSLNRFRAIAEERVRFERLFENAPNGIVVTDARGMVMTANARAERLLAADDRRALVNDVVWSRFDAGAATLLRNLVGETAAGAFPRHLELNRRDADGDRILQVRATLVPEGGAQRTMLIFSDVTLEVRARIALEKMNDELERQVRARTRQLQEANSLLLSYASFVSHDLRSPLTVIKGYLSMIHEGAVPLAESASLVEGAYNATVMMQELVQNILQLAHDEHGGLRSADIQPFDPTALIERVWSHVATMYPNRARTFSVGPLPKLQVNALLAERVFYNLLTNAAKYSASRDYPKVEVGAVETDEGAAIYVRDNGVGFDDRDAEKLFKEFSRLADAPASDGFGLGLSLVARLVRNQGGAIWAEGKSGAGATFYVRFTTGAPAPELATPALAAV